jgi:hypothetical protein
LYRLDPKLNCFQIVGYNINPEKKMRYVIASPSDLKARYCFDARYLQQIDPSEQRYSPDDMATAGKYSITNSEAKVESETQTLTQIENRTQARTTGTQTDYSYVSQAYEEPVMQAQLKKAFDQIGILRQEIKCKNTEIKGLQDTIEVSQHRIMGQEQRIATGASQDLKKTQAMHDRYITRQAARIEAIKRMEKEFPMLAKLTKRECDSMMNDAYSAPLELEHVNTARHTPSCKGQCNQICLPGLAEGYYPGPTAPTECPVSNDLFGKKMSKFGKQRNITSM